jgi:hypothetical protein
MSIETKSSQEQKLFLDIERIRRDGQTEGRVAPSSTVIDEYANLMKNGFDFPPVRTWFDGENYWLSDGFQRLAAAESIGRNKIAALAFSGSRDDAEWDSFNANSLHGSRRTKADIRWLIQRAACHANASRLSSNQIARHLGIPEATFRRWRELLSSSDDEDATVVAIRKGKPYEMDTARIGKCSTILSSRPRTNQGIRNDLQIMKEHASPRSRRILNVVGNWIQGVTSPMNCLLAIENIMTHSSPSSNTSQVGSDREGVPTVVEGR